MFVRQFTSAVVVVLLSITHTRASADEPMPKRYALLVAVTTYEHAEMNKPRLAYPEIDAKDVGRFLQDHGYEVDYLLGRNATKTSIESKLNGLAKKGNEQGVVVLGFWGQGVEFDGPDGSMFCPFDTTFRAAIDTSSKNSGLDRDPVIEPDPSSLVSMMTVMDSLKRSAAHDRLLLADCTANGSRRRAFGSRTRLLDFPDNTAVLYACSDLEHSWEGEGIGHGVFTKCLLDLFPQLSEKEAIGVAFVAERMKVNVANLVSELSGGRGTQTINVMIKGTPELRLSGTVILPHGMSDSQTDDAEKYALLIGVTKYNHARMNSNELKYPEDDARAVADLLREAGYAVDVLLGSKATKDAIEKALKKLRKQGNADGVVLIGMFGHGVQYGENGYFAPFDTSTREVKDSEKRNVRDKNGQLMLEPDPDSMVSMRSFLDAMTQSLAKNKIMLADCCREDPSAARGRNAFGSNLTTRDLPEGTAALFACSRNERAFEHDDWQHGAFTRAFLDQVIPLATQGPVGAGTLAEKINPSVQAMVTEKTMGRNRQTVTYINSGIVDLQIRLPVSTDVVTNSIGLKLKLIPAGEFVMGSPADESDRSEDEGPQHRVRISKPFYMGVTEVTQGQWFSVMQTRPWLGEAYVQDGDNSPAVNVNWDDAVEYCKRLSLKEGVTYRLPTEAEWEYACRAGKSTAYSFGNDSSQLSDYGWWGGVLGDGNAKTEQYAHTVGTRKANPYGLFDMHGNAYEWCQDVYDEKLYSSRSGATVDPISTSGSSYRVLRGGSWYLNSGYARSASRSWDRPDFRDLNLGFRVVR